MCRGKIYILLVVAALVSGCGPDPRREAEAYATRAEADRQTALTEQQMEQADELHALEVERQQLENDHKAATAATYRSAMKFFIFVTLVIAALAVAYSTFITAKSYRNMAQGFADAFVTRAQFRAHWIPLDATTRQYPLYLQYLEKGRFALVNPNVNSVTILDSRSEPDRQMIASVSGVQIAGVIAQEARKSADPAAVSIMRPTVVDAQEGGLLTGDGLMAQITEASRILAGGEDE